MLLITLYNQLYDGMDVLLGVVSDNIDFLILKYIFVICPFYKHMVKFVLYLI